MSPFFQFEADFVESLRCIPMQVRLKLDTCGIKLKLPQWHRLSPEERLQLVAMPCETEPEIQAYRETLQHWIQTYMGEPATELAIDAHPAWLDSHSIPPEVQAKAQSLNHPLTLASWAKLTPPQRFALIKLSRSNHENHNFLPALQEFGLVAWQA